MMKQINVGASSGILPSCEVLPSRAEKQQEAGNRIPHMN
jgi:hypothetical protein